MRLKSGGMFGFTVLECKLGRDETQQDLNEKHGQEPNSKSPLFTSNQDSDRTLLVCAIPPFAYNVQLRSLL